MLPVCSPPPKTLTLEAGPLCRVGDDITQISVRLVIAATAVFALAMPSYAEEKDEPLAVEHGSGGFTVKAEDGFDLWFDAWGEGPGIIFLARHANENRVVAEALSDAYRVVIYEPRTESLIQKNEVSKTADKAVRTLGEAHLTGRNLEWDISNIEKYPMELAISDLHRVADAAGIDEFVLGGYSGTARMAALFAPHSERAIGVIVGGYHILDGHDFWVGYVSAYSAAILKNPESNQADIDLALFDRRSFNYEVGRDNDEAFGTLPGPKIIWVGSDDGAANDEVMNRIFWEAKIAERVRKNRADYERLGFTFFELDGLGHGGAMNSDLAPPKIREALINAGFK